MEEHSLIGEGNEEEWICLDDGTCRNVYFVDKKSSKKTRIQPANYVAEYHINGARRYYYRGICIRCRIPSPAVCLFRERGNYCFSFNYCGSCLISTTVGVEKLRGYSEDIWEGHQDTPLQCLIDLKSQALHPLRNEYLLRRSKEASFEVNTSMKLRRNADRIGLVKRRAQQAGIPKGVFVSWGFGDVFDEYFGEVDSKNRPHGFGIKTYSDGTIYIGDWFEGLRHSVKNKAAWSRNDGLQYDGTWFNDLKHGSGILRYPDGAVYRGEFAKGYEHGHGSKTYPDGSKFEGRFRFGKRDGPGILTSPDGKVERRVFKENDVYHEKPVPNVVEVINEEEENIKLFQPESLLNLGVCALAKTMHTRQSLVPSTIVHNRLPEFVKPWIVEEFLRTMHPSGTQEFTDEGPKFGFFSLENVSLKHIKFKNYDAESFIYLTAGNKSLKKLELVNNRLDPSSLDLLCKRLFSGTWPYLEVLDLSFNKIDVMNVRNLISALQGVPNIKVLKLSGCKITATGAQIIGNFLSSNTTLQELDLSFNTIQAVGAEFIAEALEHNRTLFSLNLRQNNVGVVGGEVLVHAMKSNHHLKILCIADNKISSELATQLSARLRGTTKDVAESFRAAQLQIPAIHLEKVSRRKSDH